jgi:hypothetical protein
MLTPTRTPRTLSRQGCARPAPTPASGSIPRLLPPTPSCGPRLFLVFQRSAMRMPSIVELESITILMKRAWWP